MSACPRVLVFTALYHLDLCSTLLPCIYCRFELRSPPFSFIVCFYFLWSLHLIIIISLPVISTLKWPSFLLFFFFFFFSPEIVVSGFYFVMEYIPHPVIASVWFCTRLFLPIFFLSPLFLMSFSLLSSSPLIYYSWFLPLFLLSFVSLVSSFNIYLFL